MPGTPPRGSRLQREIINIASQKERSHFSGTDKYGKVSNPVIMRVNENYIQRVINYRGRYYYVESGVLRVARRHQKVYSLDILLNQL